MTQPLTTAQAAARLASPRTRRRVWRGRAIVGASFLERDWVFTPPLEILRPSSRRGGRGGRSQVETLTQKGNRNEYKDVADDTLRGILRH
ncbi:MAG: hypothetical protein M3461_02870 [Pseudomonadota bacterium]|nr:hypothetical protein [Pseudomonadota bacterium]